MNRRQKRKLFEILIGAVLLAGAYVAYRLTELPFPFDLLIFLPAYAVAGYDVIINAVQSIVHGEVFGENTLMSVASIGALAIGEYPEAVFVMLFYKVGALFESVAVGKSRKSIKALISMKPKTACVERGGAEEILPIEEVKIGDVVVVRPGEGVPVDGEVTSGESEIDSSALTGEALPVTVGVGSRVLSGSISKSGVLKIKVDTVFEESTVSKIVTLIENSAGTKAKAEKFITKFSRVYTPAVIAAAVLIAVVPTLVSGGFAGWLRRALIFLVVSCPCALVISVPLAYFAGIGNAAKRGILIKGSDHLETLSRADKYVFDKTGTITEGRFSVRGVFPVGAEEDELLKVAAAAESGSRHPLARAVVEECERRGIGIPEAEGFEESAGFGITCTSDGVRIAAGNAALMAREGAAPDDADGTVIHVSKDGKYLGHLSLEDTPKKTSKEAISSLKGSGCRTYMLSGDRERSVGAVCREVGIDEYRSELLPAEKTERLKEISSSGGATVFTGDGINDAPSIALADVGVAMGALGSDVAIECADVVLLDDDPMKVASLHLLAKRVRAVVTENIVFALSVKAVVLILGALGAAYMWEAVIADVGVSVVAILNSMRILKSKK